MLMHIEISNVMGILSGCYLVKSDVVAQVENIDKARWAVYHDVGIITLRAATYDEQTHFIDNDEGGRAQILRLN